MQPGFTVAELAPFRGGRGALRLGLGRMPPDAWLDRGPALPARIAAKRPILDGVPESLMVRAPARAAIAELAALVGAPGGDLRDAALATYEDLLILLPDGDAHRLMAGALAFPTDWHLAEKIGHPLRAIHAPIPTYAARLADGVDHVFATLDPHRPLVRCNWNVLENDRLRYLPDRPAMQRFDHVTAANAGDTLFVRVERQTLRRLPQSGAAVFAIGVYIEPLSALPAELARDLATAVAGLPPDEARRRGSPRYAAALSAHAAAMAAACDESPDRSL